MRRVLIYQAEEGGYWAECPSLGCVSQGETLDETLESMKEAIALWIESLTAHHEPIPPEDVLELSPIVAA